MHYQDSPNALDFYSFLHQYYHNDTMITIRHLPFILGGYLLPTIWLLQPLPSLLKVSVVNPDIAPKPCNLPFEPNNALESATKLVQGHMLGAGKE